MIQSVEKAAKPLFRERLHGGRGSISCEIVAPSAMRSVISEAHVPENDGFSFDSCGCGRRNSARLSLTEGFSTACNHTFRCDYLYGCPGRFCMLRQSESTPRQYQLFSVQLKPARRIFCGLRAARIGVLLIRAVFRVRAFGGPAAPSRSICRPSMRSCRFHSGGGPGRTHNVRSIPSLTTLKW